MNKPNHEKIYLAPEDGVYCWSSTPAPGSQHDSADAVEYVRGNLFDALKAERDALLLQLQTAEQNAAEQRHMKIKAREQRDALAAENARLDSNLSSKTELANQLKDSLADAFEREMNLKAERDALASKLGQIADAWVAAGCWPDTIEEKQALGAAINRQPDQYMRDVKAEAVQAGWNACVDYLIENSSSDLFTDGEAEQTKEVGKEYAAKVRQGGAE